MPLCSVIMSVYNEKLSELDEAIQSVLGQTFSDFEFIIVCDNPGNLNIVLYLGEIAKKDARVHILYNKENMGLALSLNVAAKHVSGKYIIRMDADDISMTDRFLHQVELMEKNNYDLIWTSYEFINENGEILDRSVHIFRDEDIYKYLPLENIIHHPTVIMKKSLFDKVGGYRKYPCAQDYDLWLRLLYNGCKMHMMPEKLLKYRVRENSTTSKKKYMQLCTLDYIRYIYGVLEKTGKDVYSYEEYTKYLKKLGVGDEKIEEGFRKAQENICEGKSYLKKHNYIGSGFKFAMALLESRFYRKHFFLPMRRSILRK